MTSPSFCGSCGHSVGVGDRFCPGCGKPISTDQPAVELHKTIAAVTPVPRQEPPAARFDPYKPVSEENPLPADCIWATAAYPGPLPNKEFHGSVPARLVAMGTLRGRPAAEIVGVIGRPKNIRVMAGGGMLRQWIKISPYSRNYHYALSFDPYDICIGITHQSIG